jgi:hypothetical protein
MSRALAAVVYLITAIIAVPLFFVLMVPCVFLTGTLMAAGYGGRAEDISMRIENGAQDWYERFMRMLAAMRGHGNGA